MSSSTQGDADTKTPSRISLHPDPDLPDVQDITLRFLSDIVPTRWNVREYQAVGERGKADVKWRRGVEWY